MFMRKFNGTWLSRNAKNCGIFALVAWTVFVLMHGGGAAYAKNSGPDNISIAAVLIQDGRYDKALAVLDLVPLDMKQKNEIRFSTLRGIASLHSGKYEHAKIALVHAIGLRESSPGQDEKAYRQTKTETDKLYTYLALVHWALGECEQALAASEKAGEAEQYPAKLFVLRADCQAKSNLDDAAFATLRAGQKRFPNSRELVERELHLLIELGLFAEMRSRSQEWLHDVQLEEGIRLLAKLHANEEQKEVIFLAEMLQLHFPREQKISLFLAQAYRETDHPLAAAQIMEDLALRDAAFALDTAELYRRAGWRKLAQLVGAKSQNQVGKLRQHFGILLEEGRFDEAAALSERLQNSGLLQDDSIRYALAYANYESGSLANARKLLRDIQDAKIFRQAAELRQMIDACVAKGWTCQ